MLYKRQDPRRNSQGSRGRNQWYQISNHPINISSKAHYCAQESLPTSPLPRINPRQDRSSSFVTVCCKLILICYSSILTITSPPSSSLRLQIQKHPPPSRPIRRRRFFRLPPRLPQRRQLAHRVLARYARTPKDSQSTTPQLIPHRRRTPPLRP